MDLIFRSRGGGKTTELIQRCHNNGGYIICQNISMAHNIHELATNMGYSIPLPLTYNEFRQNKYAGKNIKAFYIDNVELFLQSLTPVKIDSVTFNKE